MRTLKGKGAVVTGAASGIGKAIATALVEAGASVLLCDIDANGLNAVARDLGDPAIGRVTDVSDENQLEAAMRAAREAFGSVEIVVNCAGFGAIIPPTELPADQWRSVHAVTVGGVFYDVKHGVRQMLEIGIAPGLGQTPLARHELDNPEIRELFMALISVERPVEAKDIAAAAVFLASEHRRSTAKRSRFGLGRLRRLARSPASERSDIRTRTMDGAGTSPRCHEDRPFG
jgi:NAD(P)-dependent dehydrogenase (short-subunit alcohol dehydrogenase family)